MKVVAAIYLNNFNFMAFVPWPSWLKFQRSENTKKRRKKEWITDWEWFTVCPLGGQSLVYFFFITIIEARLHRVSFETCSPQTPDPIIENDLQGHIYRFCLYNLVEFGTLLHHQERTARIAPDYSVVRSIPHGGENTGVACLAKKKRKGYILHLTPTF